MSSKSRLALASGLLASANMLSACSSAESATRVDSESVPITYEMNTVIRATCEAVDVLSERHDVDYGEDRSCTTLGQLALSEYVNLSGENFVYPGDMVVVDVSNTDVLDVVIEPHSED